MDDSRYKHVVVNILYLLEFFKSNTRACDHIDLTLLLFESIIKKSPEKRFYPIFEEFERIVLRSQDQSVNLNILVILMNYGDITNVLVRNYWKIVLMCIGGLSRNSNDGRNILCHSRNEITCFLCTDDDSLI